MYLLSIIVVCKDNPKELLETLDTIRNYFSKDEDFQVIIQDGSEEPLMKSLITGFKNDLNISYKNVLDDGVYYAMNKALFACQSY